MTTDRWPSEAPTLTDGQVTLRAWHADDADDVFRACQDPGIQRWTTVPVPYLREHATGFVGDYAPRAWGSHSGAPFAVASDDADELLGSCALVRVDLEDLVGEVGYWVAPWARGRRVAQRAARLLCDWAMSDGGLARLEVRVDPENLASRAVAESLGCVFEGVLRSTILHRGQRRDLAMYALIR